METVQQVFNQHLEIFSPASAARFDFVCSYCLGPTLPKYEQCYACRRLFVESHDTRTPDGNIDISWVPNALSRMVIPMTSVLNPSRWYTWLYTYKRGHPERSRVLAALAHTYLQANSGRIAELLGDSPTITTIVPSKRGFSFNTQPFVRALSLAKPVAQGLHHTLDHVPEETLARFQYNPNAFRPGPVGVEGDRVLLLEDAWVTGATATSAAGALLRDGAEAVAIIPLARVVDADFWPPSHPYRRAMQVEYDPTAWPR